MPLGRLNRKAKNISTPVFTGVKQQEKASVQLFNYNENICDENPQCEDLSSVDFTKNDSIYWLNVHGIHDVEVVQKICDTLDIHSLTLQDILDIHQRPKVQEYQNYSFFSMKSMLPLDNDGKVYLEQLSFILGKNYVVSFQEKKAVHFDHVRHRIRKSVGNIRSKTSDYLLYTLLESILDNYFKTLETLEDTIEELEIIDVDRDPSPTMLRTMESFKRRVYAIKRLIAPIKEFVLRIERESYSFIRQENLKYYLELKDLCFMLLDFCDKLEVRLESSINLFFSIQGHRMNQIMKTLTIVSTIFIPLTFIVGIYGMNFTYIPELSLKWGYFAVWGVMLILCLLMFIFFKRKKWF